MDEELGPPPDDDLEPPGPELSEMPHLVFVSHTWPDAAFLKREVTRNDPRFFILNFKSGSPEGVQLYKRRILSALTRCGWFLVAVSALALQSKWVSYEVRWTLKHRPRERLRILLLETVDPTSIDARLAEVKTIDFRSSFDAARAELDRDIPPYDPFR